MTLNLFDDYLSVLTQTRQVHSRAVGAKVASKAGLVPGGQRAELIAAAILHDIGYGHPKTGFHAIDGAYFLRSSGFSANTCNLVAHHSASADEAVERGIDLSVFTEFAVVDDLGSAHAVLWWADMTTGPEGQDMTVADRLTEICDRYGPDDPVTGFVRRATYKLFAAGHSPIGSIQVPS